MPKIQESDEIVSLWVEAILYGLYLQTLFDCSRAVLRRRPKHWVCFVGTVLSLLVTLDIVLSLARLLQANECNSSDDRSASQTVQWYNVIKASAVAVCSLLVEGVLIYRCWIVHNRRWTVIAVSLLFWLGGAVIVIWTTYARCRPTHLYHMHKRTVESVYTTFWAFTIIMNVLTTTLIVYKIIRVGAATKGTCLTFRSIYRPDTQLQRIIRIVVESGLLCTTSSLFVFLSQAARSHYLDLASAVMIMVTGISFNLITIRVEGERQKKDEISTRSESMSTLRFAPWDWRVAIVHTLTRGYGEDMGFEVPYLEKHPLAYRGRRQPAITSEACNYIGSINIAYLYMNDLLV